MTRRLDVLLLVLAVGGAYLAYSPAPRPATVIPSHPVLSGVEARTDLSRTGAPDSDTRGADGLAYQAGRSPSESGRASMSGAPPSVSPTPRLSPPRTSTGKHAAASPRPAPSRKAPSRGAPVASGTRITAVQYAVRSTWYCDPPRSRCTAGYPSDGLYAAISPDLRTWTGRLVRVRYGGSTVTVRVVDCDCAAEHSIDLYAVAFRRLAPLSVGEITVTLELLEE